jgi:SAM-dependent methyltransferase
VSKSAFDQWTEYYQKMAVKGAELLWPSETLIRLFKGNYIPDLQKDYAGRKVIDVGFGNGNNSIFLGSLGLELYGTEVSPEICKEVSGRLQSSGLDSDLRVGTNRDIPFDADTFDFLVSWNVIHYENTEEHMWAAIAEYQRVLKPGGRFFISTTGPEHKILTNSETVGSHLYRIGRDDDFRKGQVFFYFDAPNYIQYYFSEKFDNVLVGRTHDFLMTETLDWYIVTGVKQQNDPTTL